MCVRPAEATVVSGLMLSFAHLFIRPIHSSHSSLDIQPSSSGGYPSSYELEIPGWWGFKFPAGGICQLLLLYYECQGKAKLYAGIA